MKKIKLLSKANQAIIQAYEKGYRADENGNIIFKNRTLKLLCNRGGYFTFCVRAVINGKTINKNITTHRFQAYQKYGEDIFKEGIDVRHKDGNNKNNDFENILIGTVSQNMMDKSAKSRIKQAIIASSKKRRFTDSEVELIKFDKSNGLSYNKLCEKYNTSKSTLSYLFNKSYYAK